MGFFSVGVDARHIKRGDLSLELKFSIFDIFRLFSMFLQLGKSLRLSPISLPKG